MNKTVCLALLSGAILTGCASSNTESAGSGEVITASVDVCECVGEMTVVVEEVIAAAEDTWGFDQWIGAMEARELPCVNAGRDQLGSQVWVESIRDCPGYASYEEAVKEFREILVAVKATEAPVSEQHVMETPEGGASALLDQLSGKNQD